MRALGSRSEEWITRKTGLWHTHTDCDASSYALCTQKGVRKRHHLAPEAHLETSFTHENKDPPPPRYNFNSFIEKKTGSPPVCLLLSGLQSLKHSVLMIRRFFVSNQSEQARKARSTTRSYFHPDTEQQGLLQRGFLLTLYGSVGGAQTRLSSHGNRPELSDYCRYQGASAQQPTARIRRLFIKVSFRIHAPSACFLLFLRRVTTNE